MNIRWQTNSPRDIWTVLCITRKHWWGWFDWVVPLQAYKLSSCFFPLPCFSFLPKQNAPLSNFWQRIPNFLVVSQQTSHWSLHAFRVPLLCSIIPLECSVEQVLTADLSARILLALADYWSWRVWIISKVPLKPGSHSQVINWIAHDRVRCMGRQ